MIGNLRAFSKMAERYPTEIVAEKSQKQMQVPFDCAALHSG
jgi:hypothetical protein